MKKFKDLVRENEDFESDAARTLKEKPNKESMKKIKEDSDTPPITVRSLYTKMYAKHGGTAAKVKDAQSKAYAEVEKKHGKDMRNSLESFHKKNMNEELEQLDELDKEPGGTLHRYLSSPKQRQRRVQAAIDNPQKLKKINTGIKSAETKIEKERQKQTGMNPQYRPEPKLSARDIQKMDMRYTNEEYDSVPASKALQKAHDDERKKRGLPDPSYYLKLAAQKKKEINDMKNEEVEQIDEISPQTKSSYVQKAKKEVEELKPHAQSGEYKDIAQNLIKKREKGIAMAKEETEDTHWSKSGKEAVHRETGKKTYEYREYKKGEQTGRREYRDEKGKPMGEEVEQIDEKNVPTSPEKWAQAKAQAKAKFDVYPSAYANGWAAKKYKAMGGGWKSVSEESELEEGYYKNQEIERQETERLKPPFTPDKPKKKSVVVGKKPEGYSIARQLARQAMKKYVKEEDTEKFYNTSRKTQIVKTAAKNKNENKFEPDPVLSKMTDKKDQ